jgi:pseudouridine-5'-phosphate glycosidase
MTSTTHPMLALTDEVRAALADGRAVVALESTIISHGMPYPRNVAMAREVEGIVRDGGAVPATIAVLDGIPRIGLSADELELLGSAPDVAKVSIRDLPSVVATRAHGATTVASTMRLAALAGIRVFVTGGLGGVHQGAASSMDESADLTELSRTDVAVVCAGVKSILDIGLTLERLETLGVPVVGYRTDEFPSFYSRTSDHRAPLRADDVDGQHRSRRRPRDPRLARQPHRRGRGRSSTTAPVGPRGGPLGRVHRRLRGLRARDGDKKRYLGKGVEKAVDAVIDELGPAIDGLRGQRPAPHRRRDARRSTAPPTREASAPTPSSASRSPWPGRGRLRRPAAVPLRRRPQRPRPARADDEHPQRWLARRHQRRHPGVHDRPDRRRTPSARRCAGAPRSTTRSRRCSRSRAWPPASATRVASRPTCESQPRRPRPHPRGDQGCAGYSPARTSPWPSTSPRRVLQGRRPTTFEGQEVGRRDDRLLRRARRGLPARLHRGPAERGGLGGLEGRSPSASAPRSNSSATTCSSPTPSGSQRGIDRAPPTPCSSRSTRSARSPRPSTPSTWPTAPATAA